MGTRSITRTAVCIGIVVSVAVAFVLLRGRESAPRAGQSAQPADAVAPETGKARVTPDGEGGTKTPTSESAAAGSMVRVYGTVTDVATGTALEGARIETRLSPSEERVSVEADGAGAFEYEAVGGAYHTVVCSKQGYVTQREELADKAKKDHRLDFALRRGAWVSGRVTDAETGVGVEGLTVLATPSDSGFWEYLASRRVVLTRGATNSEGTYGINAEPGACRIVVWGRKRGYLFRPDQVVTLQVEEGGTYTGVDFALERGGVVNGRLIDAEGRAIAGGHVRAVSANPLKFAITALESPSIEPLNRNSAGSDAAGAFELGGLDFGLDQRLFAEAEGYAATFSEVFRIEKGKSPLRLDLTLTAGCVVGGRVIGLDGNPIVGQPVRLRHDAGEMLSGLEEGRRQVTSGEGGAFGFTHVGRGRYVLEASDDAAPRRMGAQQGLVLDVDGVHDILDLEVVVELAEDSGATGHIEGVVVTRDGKGVPDVRVEAQRSDRRTETAGATTDADGRFTIARLRGPAYDLSVRCRDGAGELAAVRVGSDVTIELTPPTRVSGTVVTAQGEPARSCTVQLRQASETPAFIAGVFARTLAERRGRATTDENGYFQMLNVKAGAYVAFARSTVDGCGETSLFTLAAGGEVANLRIVLRPGTRFGGVVTNGAGESVAGATVELTTTPPGSLVGLAAAVTFAPEMRDTAGSATTDANGLFEMENVAPGTYSLVATHPDYARTTQPDIVVGERDTTGHRVVMVAGGSASGQYIVGGEPQAGKIVQLIGEGGLHLTATDAEGRFSLEGVPPGPYIVAPVDMNSILEEGVLDALRHAPQVVDIVDGENTEIVAGSGGGGAAVSGNFAAGGLGNVTGVSLRRPGGPALQDLNSMADIGSLIEVARYQEGHAFVAEDGTFYMDGVEPGTYILEVFSADLELDFPNPSELATLFETDLTPLVQQEVVVTEEGLQIDLRR